MPRLLLVDGHSVIFASADLRALHQRSPAQAREALLRWLEILQDAGGWTVGVVFDGQGRRASLESRPGGLSVFYSRTGQTADALIERLAAKYAATCEVAVVTEDFAERRTVEALGGYCLGVEGLLEEIQRVRSELGEAARRPPSRGEG